MATTSTSSTVSWPSTELKEVLKSLLPISSLHLVFDRLRQQYPQRSNLRKCLRTRPEEDDHPNFAIEKAGEVKRWLDLLERSDVFLQRSGHPPSTDIVQLDKIIELLSFHLEEVLEASYKNSPNDKTQIHRKAQSAVEKLLSNPAHFPREVQYSLALAGILPLNPSHLSAVCQAGNWTESTEVFTVIQSGILQAHYVANNEANAEGAANLNQGILASHMAVLTFSSDASMYNGAEESCWKWFFDILKDINDSKGLGHNLQKHGIVPLLQTPNQASGSTQAASIGRRLARIHPDRHVEQRLFDRYG
ncbi:hypothetical protein T439DRAFT_357660 [Meredithblackwellia eburnea MCA 4105]